MTLQLNYLLQRGRYRIRGHLGQGGMGAVYLAEDLNLDSRLVAIKENLITSREAQEQFKREADLLARLVHANLPRVIDHFIDEASGRQYLVMDYVEGEDLRKILQAQNGPLAEEVALAWITQVISALNYMHNWVNPVTRKSSPIIHRDIKPANIKRTPDGRIVLVDFGLARSMESSVTVTGARSVTPGYSPIEQYMGGTDVRADIYALGATLYAMVTGQRPPEALAIAAGTTPLAPPRKLNPKLNRNTEKVILRAMRAQAGERYSSVQAMHDALYPGRAISPITDRPTTRPRPDKVRAAGLIWQRVRLSSLIILLLLLTFSGIAIWAPMAVERWLGFNPLATPAAMITGWTGREAQRDTTPPTPPPGRSPTEEKPLATEAVASGMTTTATITHSPTSSPTAIATLTPTRDATALAQQQRATVQAILTAKVETTLTSVGLPPAPTVTPPLLTATSAPPNIAADTPISVQPSPATPTATATRPPTATATNSRTPAPSATATPLPTATATALPSPTSSPAPSATAPPPPTATRIPSATPTRSATPTPSATPMPTRIATATRTATLIPTATTTATRTPAPPTSTPIPPTNTPQPTTTPSPTSPPLPTATLTRAATPTPLPPPTPAPVSGSVTLVEPFGSVLQGRPTFRWSSDIQLAENQYFELVFWPAGRDPLSSSFGPAGSIKETSITVDLDKAADALPHLLQSGQEYQWGVLLVELNPYQRLQYVGGGHRFRFERSSSSGGGGGDGGGGPAPTNTPRG